MSDVKSLATFLARKTTNFTVEVHWWYKYQTWFSFHLVNRSTNSSAEPSEWQSYKIQWAIGKWAAAAALLLSTLKSSTLSLMCTHANERTGINKWRIQAQNIIYTLTKRRYLQKKPVMNKCVRRMCRGQKNDCCKTKRGKNPVWARRCLIWLASHPPLMRAPDGANHSELICTCAEHLSPISRKSFRTSRFALSRMLFTIQNYINNEMSELMLGIRRFTKRAIACQLFIYKMGRIGGQWKIAYYCCRLEHSS